MLARFEAILASNQTQLASFEALLTFFQGKNWSIKTMLARFETILALFPR